MSGNSVFDDWKKVGNSGRNTFCHFDEARDRPVRFQLSAGHTDRILIHLLITTSFPTLLNRQRQFERQAAPRDSKCI
jgi:hypothetical protein